VILDQLQSAIADRYKVERELGRGGMATVFLATDIRHERQVAIKVLHPDLAATIGADRFEREIKLAAKLQHPHILGLIDSGQADGLLYYVMPFIQGESVRDKLDREKQLSVDEALQITLEVADALGYAHAQNIIHRDIKPENVMMSNGHALVADFGIARARTEAGQQKLTQTGMAVGTPVYMSPEQATGEPVGPSADIYSLGCMLYEMLAGEPPFQGPNAMAIMARHAMEAVPSVRIVRPAVPEEVEEAILAAMEKNVADRPKTAADFCEILGTPLGLTATRRVTGRHTARHRVPTGARMPAFTTEEQEAKPVPLWKRPLVVAAGFVALVVSGYALWSGLSGPPASAAVGNDVDAKKVAVMYFNDRTDGELAYLAEGLTETLIDQLKQVSTLTVLSKDAVGRFRAKDVSIDSVIKALEPGTIVRGSVSRDGNKIRVSVNVFDGSGIEAGKGLPISLEPTDELALRTAFSDTVSVYLRQFVGEELRARELESGTRNPRAWTLFQRAEKLRKDAVAAAARGDSAAAVTSFAQADTILANTELQDPNWASPIALQAMLALNQAQAARSLLLAAPFVDRGLAHAERALKLEPDNLDALEARGRLRHAQWRVRQQEDAATRKAMLEGARADLKKVTDRDPTRAQAWVAQVPVHAQLLDPFSSYEAARNAYRLDEYASNVENTLRAMFTTAYDLEQLGTAQSHCEEGARRFPRNWAFVSCKLLMRLSDQVTSGPDSAWKELKTLAELAELAPAAQKEFLIRRHQMFVAASLARAGEKDSARKVIEMARAGREIDPEGLLLTAEALARVRLGTPADTAIAFEKLREYVIGQAAHGAGFARTSHWWWKDLKKDRRWNEFFALTARS
jgi:TolB-like protein